MRPRQHLVIDGDDTLWENNVYFEDAVEEFIDLLQHSTLSRGEVRAVLDDIERANLGTHGYGSAAFGRNLDETFRRLAEREIDEAELEQVATLGRRILSQPLELRPEPFDRPAEVGRVGDEVIDQIAGVPAWQAGLALVPSSPAVAQDR